MIFFLKQKFIFNFEKNGRKIIRTLSMLKKSGYEYLIKEKRKNFDV